MRAQAIYKRTFRVTWQVLLGLCVSLTKADASPVKWVIPGKEIAVGSVRVESGSRFRRQAASYTEVHIPRGFDRRNSSQRGHITVVGLPTRFHRQSAAPVPADEAAIAHACAKIQHANPGKSLLCEPNVLFRISGVPNDPRYSSLYGLKKMRLPLAWDITSGKAGVIAAVVDTGVDYTHQDLVDNIVINSAEVPNNGIDDDNNGFIDDVRGYDFVDQDANPMDSNGHGTHCAGIIGARGNNGVGVVGVNWTVGLLPVRVLSQAGSGAASDIAMGIVYAVDRGAVVINLSLGGPSQSQFIEEAIQYALDHGVLVVAAAGNNGTDNDRTPSYPASSTKRNVIAVAASTSGDTLAIFSNYGLESVDVAAPGEGILSTVPGNAYEVYDGTSMAAPHVSGLVALLKSLDATQSMDDIRDVILSTAALRAGLREKVSTGGRVDALAAVQALVDPSAPTPTPVPTATATPRPSGGIRPDPTPSGGGGSTGPVARLSLRVLVQKKTVILFGNAFDSAGVALAGKAVSLQCSGKHVADYTTLQDGAYLFNVKRRKKAQRCQSSAANGVISSPVKVRKK